MAVWRMSVLSLTEIKVNRQLKQIDGELSQSNPLGRVLSKAQQSELELEDLALRVEESILEELPRLERGQSLIKLFAAVAPLLGLLGTVTGMIGTFQSITLFGTSDPKLMAGGISTALVTTVLGLVVAIPMTLLYAVLNTRNKSIVYILQEQAAGVIAERAEAHNAATKA
jgi:biopolymer transport protein ExbB